MWAHHAAAKLKSQVRDWDESGKIKRDSGGWVKVLDSSRKWRTRESTMDAYLSSKWPFETGCMDMNRSSCLVDSGALENLSSLVSACNAHAVAYWFHKENMNNTRLAVFHGFCCVWYGYSREIVLFCWVQYIDFKKHWTLVACDSVDLYHVINNI